MAKVWLITGASKGFGRVWARAALERGDSVAATARDTSSLDDLVEAHGERAMAVELDVTDKSAIDRSVAAAHERFGRLDVVVNNAGYGQFGAIEEVSEEDARRQIETNLFGPLWVTKAAIPILREQRSGHILQISSIGGVLAFPILGLYHASKWGLEAFSQSLSYELEEFGVNVTIIEPGGYTTAWSGSSAGRSSELPVYDGVRERRFTAPGARPIPARRPRGDRSRDPRAGGRRAATPARVLRQPRPGAGEDPSTPSDWRRGSAGTTSRDGRRGARTRAEAAGTRRG